MVDAAAEGKDLLSPDSSGDVGVGLASSPEGVYGILSPESSEEPIASSSRPSRSPTRTRSNHGRAATEPPTTEPPHLTVTRVPASRLSFFPPPAKPKSQPRVRASEELPRPGDSGSNGRARAGSDLPPPTYGRPSPNIQPRSRDYFSLLTPPHTNTPDYFTRLDGSTAPQQQGQDALAAAKSLGRVAGRAAGWLADALAIPVPPPLPGVRDDLVELGNAGNGKGKGKARDMGTRAPARNGVWFAPRTSSTDSISTSSSTSLSPFVPPRAKNRRVIGDAEDEGGEGIRMASSPPRVQAQPEARRGMIVPSARR